MNLTNFALSLALLSALALPAQAADQAVDFTYDDGTPVGGLQFASGPPAVGSILAVEVLPEHAFTLGAVQIAFWGDPGKVEVHVWQDNGGRQPGSPEGKVPDASADLVKPRTVTVGKKGEWIEVDFTDEQLSVGALQPFWIGVRIVETGPNVAVDAKDPDRPEKDAHSFIDLPGKDKDGMEQYGGLISPYNFLIRIAGTYSGDLKAKRWFTEVTEAAGIATGGRMAFGDYDGDGDDDLLFGGATLYRNDGKGHFEDVSVGAALTGLGGGGGVWGDYDGDGKLDIFVFGGKERLLRNKGDGTFVEISPGMFTESADRDFPTEGALWTDVDNDGRLDIYCANYEHVIKDKNGNDVLGVCDDDFLWHNNGDGTFTEVGTQFGLRKSGKQCGRGPTALDWDQDGDTDIYVNNYRFTPNFFWRNDFPVQKFIDIAKKNGTRGSGKQGAYGHGTGAQWVDADDDGDFDLFAANLAHPRFIAFSDRSRFFRNDGADAAWGFTELREQTGIAYSETQSAPSFADLDNDGDMDLVIGAYYGDRMGRLWRNDGLSKVDGAWLNFSDATYEAGWQTLGCASLAWADIDGDGDLDNVANNQLFRNDYSVATGTTAHWLKVKLHGVTKVNTAAIGAWVTVETGDGRVMSRVVSGGQGLATQDSLTLHFGLGAATQVQKVTVHWPGLPAEEFGPFSTDRLVEITEAKGVTARKPSSSADAGSDVSGSDAGSTDGGAIDGKGSDVPSSTGGASGGCTASPKSGSPWFACLIVFAGVCIVARRRIAVSAGRAWSAAAPRRGCR